MDVLPFLSILVLIFAFVIGDGFWSESNGLLIWNVKKLTIVCFDPQVTKNGKEMIIKKKT